jgi:hypothetical protein
MRWLLILLLTLSMSCATLRVNAEPESISPPPPLAYKVIKQQGWVSMNEKGNLWFLMAEVNSSLYRIGSCQLKYKSIWVSNYYVHGNDFGARFLSRDKKSLSQCVEWVEHQAIGDFFI